MNTSTVVGISPNSIRIPTHLFVTGDQVKYETGGGDAIGGLTNASIYYIIKISTNYISLATSLANANNGQPIPLTSYGIGASHTLSNLVATTTYKSIRRFFPRLSSSIISELSVKINNETKSFIREYGMLNAILNDIKKEYDDVDSELFDTLQEHTINSTTGYIDNTNKTNAVVRNVGFTDKYSDANKKKFFINKWLGPLNEGNRYIDTTGKDIQVVIKLAPANILYRGVHANNTSYVTNNEYSTDYILSDIYCTIDVLDEIPESGNFVFNDYMYIEGLYSDNNKKSLTTIETNKPVKWLLGTFNNPSRLVESELQLTHCNTNDTKFGPVLQDFVDIGAYNAGIPNSLLFSYEISKFHKDQYLYTTIDKEKAYATVNTL